MAGLLSLLAVPQLGIDACCIDMLELDPAASPGVAVMQSASRLCSQSAMPDPYQSRNLSCRCPIAAHSAKLRTGKPVTNRCVDYERLF